jgi:glutamate N-acetyltransferase/amino-acid N-acetyltransferase
MLPQTRFAPLPPFCRTIEGGVTSPRGFLAAGVASGVKKSGKADLGILVSQSPGVSAATFTSNAAAAAPVRLTRETSDCSHLRAVVVNAGNANACTGKQGLADAARMRILTANGLRLPVEQVAVASTGIIGVPLPMDRIEPGIAAAVKAVGSGGRGSGGRGVGAFAAEEFAGAIRTTDKHAKYGALQVELPEGSVKLGFAAKGCGMISPNMATMLCFVTCDAAVSAAAWSRLMGEAVAASFNRITVDGQESTNDMVLGFANGASDVVPGEEGLARLGEALTAALLSLAVSIVADGEGSTRTMKLAVTGASDAPRAEAVARAVANSPLVKTAFYGRDANWGRIMQAIGQALGRDGHRALPARIAYEDVVIVERGQPVALDGVQRDRLTTVMHQPEIALTVALNGPGAETTVYFSDLTHDYVTLNAEYST